MNERVSIMANANVPIAIVTGGSRGIGQAIVKALDREGYAGAFCFQSNEAAASQTLEFLEDERWLAQQVDVRDSAAMRSFFDQVTDTYGRLDVVVHAAGVTDDRPLPVMDIDAWHRVIDINLTGAFNACQAGAMAMVRQKSGSIVLIGSVVGRDGNIGQANYSASKAGMAGLGRSAAAELARWNVRVNVVEPGFIETDMTSGLSVEKKNAYLERIPLRRFGKVEEVAELVTYLASNKSRYITRQTIGIDGGLLV